MGIKFHSNFENFPLRFCEGHIESVFGKTLKFWVSFSKAFELYPVNAFHTIWNEKFHQISHIMKIKTLPYSFFPPCQIQLKIFPPLKSTSLFNTEIFQRKVFKRRKKP